MALPPPPAADFGAAVYSVGQQQRPQAAAAVEALDREPRRYVGQDAAVLVRGPRAASGHGQPNAAIVAQPKDSRRANNSIPTILRKSKHTTLAAITY